MAHFALSLVILYTKHGAWWLFCCFFARISCVFKHFLGDLLAFFFIFLGDFFHFFTTKISFWY
jgi:hypothetical protein